MAKHWQAGRRGKEINKTSILENNVNLHNLVGKKVELKTTITKQNHKVHKVIKFLNLRREKLAQLKRKEMKFLVKERTPHS